ncbi:flagellar protein FlaG [Ferribacterium limneticum]|uniref:flagellar protein FlaG n=1 Tax=Ferribacterium limneticum TaxID=76259 RepID=UPI001CFC2177|nr:flagellar protein FlaG [Ferribacterium limneticum]UCV19773.1 flagellar protein FlaG [Ferribacterium limneticum]
MNIESVKSASPLLRTPLPEAATKVEHQIPDQGNRTVAMKASDTSKNPETYGAQNENKSSGLSVEDAVKRLADFVAPTQSQINFSIDQDSGVSVVKILDSQSKEVIRQFPSEEAIALAQALDKLQGLLIRDKA